MPAASLSLRIYVRRFYVNHSRILPLLVGTTSGDKLHMNLFDDRAPLNSAIIIVPMTSYPSQPSSAVASITDLDGYINREYAFGLRSYGPTQQDEFGFDPPSRHFAHPIIDPTYSPPEMNDWPAFGRQDGNNDMKASQSYEIDKFISQTLPNATTAISRFGQVTPPRTNSEGSIQTAKTEKRGSTKTNGHQRKTKQQLKEPEQPATITSGRKRRKTTKAAANKEEIDTAKDAKRRASLEKNRLAAAKCRINKKEKIEQLQRDSHDKVVHNAFLKEQIMRMKEETQRMNAMFLAHANCEGCKSPEEIQKQLFHLGNEFYAQQTVPNGPTYGDFSQMQYDGMSVSSRSVLPEEYILAGSFRSSMLRGRLSSVRRFFPAR